MSEYDECRDCGAMVGSVHKHRAWHSRLSSIETAAAAAVEMAEDAQETAEESANILFQKGIQI